MFDSNLLQVNSNKVLDFDVQCLFGRTMKRTEIIAELLPIVGVVQVSETKEESGGLQSLDDWLEGFK